jgi:hypothetical protein
MYYDPATGVTRPPQDAGFLPVTSIRMMPETRILITLLERFQPERMASVHAHSLKSTPGDAPGISVDPRGMDPRTGQPIPALASQTTEDEELASRMVTEGRSRLVTTPLPPRSGRGNRPAFDPFTGNPVVGGGPMVHYTSTRHAEGTSLGGYAPVPVPGVRAGMTTLTIEVPKYRADSSAALNRVEDLHSDLLNEIFLGDPAAVAGRFPVR